MKTARRGNRKISTLKAAAGIVLAVAVLVIAQNLALNLSEIPFVLGVPGAVCNVLAGVLYIVFTYMGAKLICRKFLKVSMDEMRIPRINLTARWRRCFLWSWCRNYRRAGFPRCDYGLPGTENE